MLKHFDVSSHANRGKKPWFNMHIDFSITNGKYPEQEVYDIAAAVYDEFNMYLAGQTGIAGLSIRILITRHGGPDKEENTAHVALEKEGLSFPF